MHSHVTVAVVVMVALWAAPAHAQTAGTEQAVQRLTMADGSQVYGHVQTTDADTLTFRTIAGVVLVVPRAQVREMREARGHLANGEFLPADSHDTRLLFAPTARSLKRGEGYVGVYELFLPFVQVGITDRLSVGGGTPLYFGGGSRPFWITPKLQLLAREKVQVAGGFIHVSGVGENVGIAYGVTTLGTSDKAATIGLGYGYSEDGVAPIVMVGGEYRASRRIKWVTENWVWQGGNGFVSGGVRFLGERLSADLGIMVPLFEETIPLPMVSFAWSF